jgi:YidC/Oxa1 family membrane protein insertase
MEASRLVFLIVLCVSLFMLGENWMKAYGPKPQVAGAPAKGMPGEELSPVPQRQPGVAGQAAAPVGASPSTPPAYGADSAKNSTVTVRTDVMLVEIGTIGGDIRKVSLLRHGSVDDPAEPFVLLQPGGEHTYVAQSGLVGAGLATHKTPFVADATALTLEPAQNELVLTLTEAEPQRGSKTTKRYRFTRGSYVIDVSQEVRNTGAETLSPFAYYKLVRDEKPPKGDSRWVPTFTGMAAYTEKDKYKKIAFSDVAKGKVTLPKDVQEGWIGMVQHYFVSAWLPAQGVPREFYARSLGEGLFEAGVIVPAGSAAPGEAVVSAVPIYVGPQEQDKLAALAPGLDLTVDYGWLTVIAVPLFWVLAHIHDWVKNWGVAIILLTILIKLAFYPLSAASYRSMAKMRVLAPKLQKLKEVHGEDRQKLHQAMVEMYKTEKINPLGGCLPIVVQIPVFIALYWVLLGSVEMRQAPFMLWIKDLSAQDPFYVLPVLMGLSMIIQTRLNPEPPDPVQAKIMKIMPIAFSIFFFFFPAGLVLYWLVNNILSIAQQWAINHQLEKAGLGANKR